MPVRVGEAEVSGRFDQLVAVPPTLETSVGETREAAQRLLETLRTLATSRSSSLRASPSLG